MKGEIMKDWLMVVFVIICWIAAMEIVKDRVDYTPEEIMRHNQDLIEKKKEDCIRYGKNDYDCRRINTTIDL